MIKKRALVIFTIIPFILGYAVAQQQSKKPPVTNQTVFYTTHVVPNDKITLANQGNIFTIDRNAIKQITQNQQLAQPVPVGDKFIAITKKSNYSTLLEYNSSGQLIRTLFNGNTGNIDTMSWISDPSVNQEQNKVAYVSDKDRTQTQVPDNALYVLNLVTGKSTHIAKPDPYSGGLTHPVWDPVNSNILLYDYYQYDPKTLNPYSTIMEYNKTTGDINPLTTDQQNAYQESFSPDRKHLLFLLRNADTLNVSLYIADITGDGLSNERKLLSGDLAYPLFSNSTNYIYYLSSSGNNGYNLYSAQIKKYTLTNILPITSGSLLLGNSSFNITRVSK